MLKYQTMSRGSNERNQGIGLTVGQELFILASVKGPASVCAQAAIIARECKIDDLNPIDYLISEKTDSEIVDYLVNLANKQHSISRTDFRVKGRQLIGIYNEDFKLAKRLLTLNFTQLEQIYDEYYYKFLYYPRRREYEIRNIIENIISPTP